ncbi:MAG: family 1 glycosylhydrolase [Gemmatimonadetes bacterium]|nr:family 1 glycosylhydrolase [Gemmatimonadota bacterium]
MTSPAPLVSRRARAARIARVALGALALLYVGTCTWFDRKRPSVTWSDEATTAFDPHWPAGFLWGTATAAHQVEGGNTHNDWSRFERGAGHVANGDVSGRAADHWNRVAEDVALMQALGANAYRFSLEWSRLEPIEGGWDDAAWNHYAAELTALRAAHIEPVVTLLHFTLPLWLADRGGLTAPDFPAQFARFAAEAARRLGGQVTWWCTINEPQVAMYFGYVEGTWPPARKDNAQAVAAFDGMLRAHAQAAAALRTIDRDAKIGLASNMIAFEPAHRWNLLEQAITSIVTDNFNWAFYDSIRDGRRQFAMPGFPTLDEPAPELKGTIDWIGINYYRRNLVRFAPGAPGMVSIGNGPGPLSDAGVEIYPQGLLSLLREGARRYHLPVVVTENGVADSSGRHRPAYVRTHAWAARQAIADGVDLRGFFHWSLMDNFEWAEGYRARFGLYALDRATMARTPAAGAEEFRRLAPAR